ncbi:MAG: class I SAM-dependent methyltransferase [Desulfovibrio sp.]|nr:MAG: class I SAM-dependent methyltransferase [Desulfovibrio sp.]
MNHEQTLQGIPETMLIPLWARAAETRRRLPIIKDDKALKRVESLDYNFSKYDGSWLTQVGVAIRTMLLDTGVRDIVHEKGEVVVINLGAGLDTRFERLKHIGIAHWYDVDVPEAIELRQRFFTESDRNSFVAGSMFEPDWTEAIDHKGAPVLIIAEGLFMYFSEKELKPLFQLFAQRFPGADILFEMLAPFMVGKAAKHESLKKMDSPPEFKWGLKDTRDMEDWHPAIRLVNEWNYFDYHKKRWKWLGLLGRLPVLRPRFASRIVHLKYV